MGGRELGKGISVDDGKNEKPKSALFILKTHKSLIDSIGPDAAERLMQALELADGSLASLPPDIGAEALDAWAAVSERELVRVSGAPVRHRGEEFARAICAMELLAKKISDRNPEAGQWVGIAKACHSPADLADSILRPPSSRPGQLVIRPSASDDGAAEELITRFNDNQEELPYWLQGFFQSIPEKWFVGISREDIAESFYSSRTHPIDAMGKLNQVLAPNGLALYPLVQGKIVARLRLARVTHTATSGEGEFLKGFVTDDESLIKDADGYLEPVMRQIYLREIKEGNALSEDVRHAYLHERQHLFDSLSGYSAKANRMDGRSEKIAFLEATAYARDSISRLEDMEDVATVRGRLESIGEKNGIVQPFMELAALIESSGMDRQKAADALRDCIDRKYSTVLGISFSRIFGSVL